MEIINIIPKENIVVIRGEKDRYFFDVKTADSLRLKGVKIIEVAGAGHNWSQGYNKIIDELIK